MQLGLRALYEAGYIAGNPQGMSQRIFDLVEIRLLERRGLQQMVESHRYCLDVAQQVNALTAAAREVSVLVLEAHLRACVRDAVEDDDGEAAIREITDLLRKSLRGGLWHRGVRRYADRDFAGLALVRWVDERRKR